MKVAFDTSPIEKNLAHKVRGSGFYVKHLKNALEKVDGISLAQFTDPKSIANDSDLVHFPYFDPFFLTLPLRRPYRTVVTVHDLTPIIFAKHFPAGIKGRIKWNIQKSALKSVNAIITDSESSKEDIIRIVRVSDQKVHVVPLAPAEYFKKLVLSKEEKDTILKKYDLPEQFILYVGDVTWNKNLPNLVRAIKKTKYTLVMIGKALAQSTFDRENPWNQDLVTVEKLITGDARIKKVGYLSDDELVTFYNLASVFIMPSLYEGFGLPILEAMSCGTPVITAKSGSIPEVAKDAALYIDPTDGDSILDGVHKLMQSQKLQNELSEKGLQNAKDFSWKKTAQMTFDVYNIVATQ